jgi:hypothetical protein
LSFLFCPCLHCLFSRHETEGTGVERLLVVAAPISTSYRKAQWILDKVNVAGDKDCASS